MRPIAKSTLRAFWTRHADVEDELENWYGFVEKADWRTFAQVRADFPATDLVRSSLGDKLVFNIKGNHYRLVCRIEFGKPQIFILWVGTHAEYDRLEVKAL